MDFAKMLDGCSDFECIFKVVKSAVKRTTGRGRVGLILGLSDLPNYIGAFHQLGSNFIIMNKNLLDRVLASRNKGLINAYVFHILLHEYLHSLGHVNEQETQIITYAITEEALGPEHPATKIARYGIAAVFSNIPRLEYRSYESGKKGIEIVKDFETDNLNYFG